MKVAAIQHDVVWEDAAATLALVTPLVASAAADGARLIVLIEMFATGFSMHPERIAEDEGGPSEQYLAAQAVEHDAYLLASIAQRGADGAFRNNAVVVRPDGHVDRYAKIHPFSYADADKEYTAGDRFLTVTLDDVRVSAFVCYDLRFADDVWGRALDTDLYVVSANWPSPRVEHWRALLRARAIENQAYVLGVNRVGRDRELDYPGGSALIDPMGVTVFGGGDRAAVLSAEVDPGAGRATRQNFPFPSCFCRITKIQHFETPPLPRATHV